MERKDARSRQLSLILQPFLTPASGWLDPESFRGWKTPTSKPEEEALQVKSNLNY